MRLNQHLEELNPAAPHLELKDAAGEEFAGCFLTVLIQLQHLLNRLFCLTVPLEKTHNKLSTCFRSKMKSQNAND